MFCRRQTSVSVKWFTWVIKVELSRLWNASILSWIRSYTIENLDTRPSKVRHNFGDQVFFFWRSPLIWCHCCKLNEGKYKSDPSLTQLYFPSCKTTTSMQWVQVRAAHQQQLVSIFAERAAARTASRPHKPLLSKACFLSHHWVCANDDQLGVPGCRQQTRSRS